MKFSLLWANHDERITPAFMTSIAATWVSRYFRDAHFLTIGGRPVVTVFIATRLRDDAVASGSTLAAYVAIINKAAQDAGLPGVYLIAGDDDTSVPDATSEAPAAEFSAVSAYNYHHKSVAAAQQDAHWYRSFHGYDALDASYRAKWAAARALPIDYIVPLSSKWKHRL